MSDAFSGIETTDAPILAHPDGLVWQTPRNAFWSDPTFLRERAQLATAVAGWAARGKLRLLRIAPTPHVTEALAAQSVSTEIFVPVDAGRSAAPPEAGVPPELNRMAAALLDDATLRLRSLGRLIEDDVSALVEIAYDRQPEVIRQALRRLAGVRSPVHANGSLGPYSWSADSESPGQAVATVGRSEVETLREYGWLIPWFGVLRMPVSARLFLWERGSHIEPDDQKQLHRHLADAAGDTLEDRLEKHHHRIAAGDWEAALNEKPFYVSDLRAEAYRLSVVERDWHTAARVYRKIVDIDDRDAYAWHYLGFNLSRAEAPPEAVIEALERSVELQPENPLYQGRALAARLEAGAAVSSAFEDSLRQHTSRLRTANIEYLAKPVLQVLKNSPPSSETERIAFDAIKDRWRVQLSTRNLVPYL